MSDANWGNTKEEKFDLIEAMEVWCKETGMVMPLTDSRFRIDVIKEQFNELKREYWEKVKLHYKKTETKNS